MTEEYLFQVWKFRLFKQTGIKTTKGEDVVILSVGELNKDAGPDFFNARIKIGNTTWAGNIEIHVYSSDWEKHHHHKNKNYDNIILHVVFENNKKTSGPKNIPCIELKGLINTNSFNRYCQIKEGNTWIPCMNLINTVDTNKIKFWQERLVIERLERKIFIINERLTQYKYNWEEVFYHQLASAFGLKVNSLPFELLARSTPLNILRKEHSQDAIEAILLGQAGLLHTKLKDKHAKFLYNEYSYYKKKYKLENIDGKLWKMMRMKPLNFPTIRISQFSDIIYNQHSIFSSIIEAKSVFNLKQIFTAKTSKYWETHYTFDKPASKKIKKTGEQTINSLIINTVIPFLFVYGKIKQEDVFCERAITFLSEIKGEKNLITTNFLKIGLSNKNALESQALLELKNEYCNKKKCMDCSIGNQIISIKQ